MSRHARAAFPLLLIAALASPAAAETWERSFDVTGEPTLALRTNDGNVEVESWNRKTIGIRVVTSGWRLGPRGVTVDARQSGDRVDVEVRTPHWGFWIGTSSEVHIVVQMPARATLDVHTGDGSVSVQPRAGDIRVHTGDGSITATGLKGEISLETADGRVSATNLDGRVRVHSGDGHLSVSGRFDGLELTSGDGGIEARVEPGSRVMGEWLVRTGDGRVHLGVPRDLKADLDVHTGDGGITLDLPVAITGRVTHSTVVGAMNGGGPPIMIRSGDGSITIGPV